MRFEALAHAALQQMNLSRASIRDVAEYLSIDESRARVSLETLADSGMIEAGGNGRGRYYMLSQP